MSRFRVSVGVCCLVVLTSVEAMADGISVGYRLKGESFFGRVQEVTASFALGEVRVSQGTNFTPDNFSVPDTGGFNFTDTSWEYFFNFDWLGGEKRLIYSEGSTQREFILTGVGLRRKEEEVSMFFGLRED